MLKRAILISVLSMASVAVASPPPAEVGREISGLFAALDHSGCQFNRNGSWYDAGHAHAHLQGKYNYLARRGAVTTTERFIDLAASRSSMSGRPYQVRCGATPAVPSATWFNRELVKLRAARH